MALPVTKIILGVDVAKEQLVIHDWLSGQTLTIDNQPQAIDEWLRAIQGPTQLAIEPTSHYHHLIVDQALAHDIEVYLVGPRQLAHYREAVGGRNKTDQDDAQLLARYLAHEGQHLRRFQPRSAKAQRLWSLILRRGTVVQCRQRLQQSFAEVEISTRALMRHLKELLIRLEHHILALIRQLGWYAEYRCALSMPGIGPSNAAALTAAYHRGAFASSDAFVAYLGLDVRIRESGQYKGQRKLTKRGEAELRRLIYCAARPATSHQRFADYRQRQIDKGLPKIAANIILGRKLVRIAFALMENKEMFVTREIATG